MAVIGNLDHLRIADVATFLTVSRVGSVTIAARELDVTPSQVSKAVARLEGFLKERLLSPSGRGITLTEPAKELRPALEDLLRRAQELHTERSPHGQVAIATPSYLAMEFLGPLAAKLGRSRVRAIEAGPSTIRAMAQEGAIEMALTMAPEKLPRTWVSSNAGAIKVALFGSPSLGKTLGSKPTLERLRRVPFVMPIRMSGAQLLPGDDGCPLSNSERVHGHEASTIGVALEIAAESDQLVYGPEITARRLIEQGRLVEIQAPGFRNFLDLFLHANAERVLARIQRAVLDIIKKTSASE